VLALFAQQRASSSLVVLGVVDLVWGVLFLTAHQKAADRVERSQ
jgi:hypothetical protein